MLLSAHTERFYGVKGTREQGFTERQDIWTGPVHEKTNSPEREACLAETVGSRSRKRFLVLFRIIEQDQELVKNS